MTLELIITASLIPLLGTLVYLALRLQDLKHEVKALEEALDSAYAWGMEMREEVLMLESQVDHEREQAWHYCDLWLDAKKAWDDAESDLPF